MLTLSTPRFDVAVLELSSYNSLVGDVEYIVADVDSVSFKVHLVLLQPQDFPTPSADDQQHMNEG